MSSQPRFLASWLFSSVILLLLGFVGASAQEGSSVSGRVLERDRGIPVSGVYVKLGGTEHEAFTDSLGAFQFSKVTEGRYLLTLDHLAFGVQTDSLEVSDSAGDLRLVVWVASGTVDLDPLIVEALSREEREWRSSGVRPNFITREQLEEYEGAGETLGGVLSIRVPGISLDRRAKPGCVEFRNAPSLLNPLCRPPLVIVDGVRTSNSNHFLETTPIEHVESVRVLPAAASGVRYGTGSAWGVIRVETRRPGISRQIETARLPMRQGAAYNWDLEPGGHPWGSALAGATVGTLGGLAIALSASGECSPLSDRRAVKCPARSALLATVATFTLPVAGGSLGANIFGRTEHSRGDVFMTTLGAAVPMFAGYFFATSGRDGVDFPAQQAFGRILVVAGIPIVSTLADRVFRTVPDPPPLDSGMR